MNKTTRDLLIILFILMIFTAISRRNKTKSTVNCGSVDPRIPDAPAKCEPI